MSSVNPEGIVGFHSYSFVISQMDTWYASNKFTIKGIDHCNFVIEVFAQFQPLRYQIAVKKSDRRSVVAKITLSIYGEEITRIVRNWEDSCFFIKRSEASPSFRIEVHCKIIWYGTAKDSIPVQAFLNPFSGFYNVHSNSSLSDLKISISGEELSAHKLILAAHSPVFLNMFETDMKEKRESRIVIEGIDVDVMKNVLSILYTGHDEDLDEIEMAEKVLIVAERYDMKALKRLCEWKLFQKLNVTNVLDILVKADNCNAEILRTGCMGFIVQNKERMANSGDLIKTICRNKPDLISELLQTFMITQ